MAMASSRLLFFLFSIVLHLVPLTVAQKGTQVPLCLNDKGNFTTNSPYEANRNQLLSSFSSTTEINYGFYNSSYGQNPNTVYALALCRGDVDSESCRSCIKNSTIELPKNCPNQKESFIWYDDCMLRYSNRSFFGNMEFGPYVWMYSSNNVSEPNQFNQTLVNLLDSLKKKAASGDSLLKFAVGNATTPSSQIYGLVQCTPDLSKQECTDCLNNATALIPKCCDGREGARVLSPSCNFRYEKGIFYDLTVAAPTPTTLPSPSASPSTPPPSISPSTPPPSAPPSLPPTSVQPTPTTLPSPSASPSTPPPSVSPSTPPPSAPPSLPPTSMQPSPQKESQSPPPTPTSQQPSASQSPPPSPTNSATQKGKGIYVSGTIVLISVPLLLLQYFSSMSVFF